MDLSLWHVDKDQIKLFREWITQQSQLPDIPDEYLARFLHSCYFDLEAAKKSIECYIKLKTREPNLFLDRNFEHKNIKISLETCNLGIMPATTGEGISVIWARILSPDASNFFPEEGLKILFMTVDRFAQERKGSNGIIFIYDIASFGFRHLFKLSISLMRNYFEYFQEAAPMRLIAIHVINIGSLASSLMRMIKPLIYKENLKKLHFHAGSDVENSLKEITRDQIPKEYGGSGPSLKKLHGQNIRSLEAMSEWFKADEKLKLVEVNKMKK